jgi:LEA14-like dessication related protein
MKNGLLFLALFGVIYFGRKVFSAGRVQYSIIGADLKKQSLRIELLNPGNMPLNFESLIAALSINGRQFGTLDFRQRTNLGPTSRTIINIPIRLNPIGGAQLLTSILTGSTQFKGSTIDIDGTLNAGGLIIPIKNNIPLAI